MSKALWHGTLLITGTDLHLA